MNKLLLKIISLITWFFKFICTSIESKFYQPKLFIFKSNSTEILSWLQNRKSKIMNIPSIALIIWFARTIASIWTRKVKYSTKRLSNSIKNRKNANSWNNMLTKSRRETKKQYRKNSSSLPSTKPNLDSRIPNAVIIMSSPSKRPKFRNQSKNSAKNK